MGEEFIIAGTVISNLFTAKNTSNQFVFGANNTTTLNFSTPSANRILTIPDPGADSSFILAAGTQTITGDKTFTGAVNVNSNINLAATTSSAGSIMVAGTRSVHFAGTRNIFIGPNAGNTSVSGTDNCIYGSTAGSGLTSGSSNILMGSGSGSSITTGSGNIMLNGPAGSTSTANAISIGATAVGTGDINIGTAGTHDSCKIAGVFGTTALLGSTVLITSAGLLGTSLSSEKYKDNIVPLPESVLTSLYKLGIKQFTYKEDTAPSKEIQYGMIAEDVEEIWPDIVIRNRDGDVHTVQYQKLVPVMVKCLQNHRRQLRRAWQTVNFAGTNITGENFAIVPGGIFARDKKIREVVVVYQSECTGSFKIINKSSDDAVALLPFHPREINEPMFWKISMRVNKLSTLAFCCKLDRPGSATIYSLNLR